MKKALLIALALFVISAPAGAQQLSIWADDAMTSCSVATTGPYQAFNLYVFLEAGPDGAFAVEYKLAYPAGHIASLTTPAPFVAAATIGSWLGSPGISAPFISCQTGMVWVVSFTLLSPDTVPGFYAIEPNETTGVLGVAICPGDRPIVDATAINEFGFNADCVVGTEESSWGAIKSMME
jgi:hypothetical protein